jgi:thiol-disulfide isomerase/thioredoxin
MNPFLKKYKILIILSVATVTFIVLPLFFLKNNILTNSSPLPPINLPQLFTNDLFPNPFENTNDANNTNKTIFIVHFWASWCGPCTEEFPTLLKAADQLSSQIQFVAVNLDEDPNTARQFLEKFDYKKKNIIYLWDKDQTLSKQYGTIKLPESYILDFKRYLIRKIAGSTNWENSKNIEYLKRGACAPQK